MAAMFLDDDQKYSNKFFHLLWIGRSPANFPDTKKKQWQKIQTQSFNERMQRLFLLLTPKI